MAYLILKESMGACFSCLFANSFPITSIHLNEAEGVEEQRCAPALLRCFVANDSRERKSLPAGAAKRRES